MISKFGFISLFISILYLLNLCEISPSIFSIPIYSDFFCLVNATCNKESYCKLHLSLLKHRNEYSVNPNKNTTSQPLPFDA